jgi:hypothetical protein
MDGFCLFYWFTFLTLFLSRLLARSRMMIRFQLDGSLYMVPLIIVARSTSVFQLAAVTRSANLFHYPFLVRSRNLFHSRICRLIRNLCFSLVEWFVSLTWFCCSIWLIHVTCFSLRKWLYGGGKPILPHFPNLLRVWRWRNVVSVVKHCQCEGCRRLLMEEPTVPLFVKVAQKEFDDIPPSTCVDVGGR